MLENFVGQYIALFGFGALIAVLVNVLKTLNVVKDGTAQNWSLGFNLVGLVGLFVLKVFVPQVDLDQANDVASQFAKILELCTALFVQLGGAKLFYGLVKNIPVVGKSFSG